MEIKNYGDMVAIETPLTGILQVLQEIKKNKRQELG